MLDVKKLLIKTLGSLLASTETLATGATLVRFSNLRILVLNQFAGANSTLTIPTADRPSAVVLAPLWRTDVNDRSTAVGYMAVYSTNGYVQRYYGGTYNASGSGASNVAATNKVSGVAVWAIGVGTP